MTDEKCKLCVRAAGDGSKPDVVSGAHVAAATTSLLESVQRALCHPAVRRHCQRPARLGVAPPEDRRDLGRTRPGDGDDEDEDDDNSGDDRALWGGTSREDRHNTLHRTTGRQHVSAAAAAVRLSSSSLQVNC